MPSKKNIKGGRARPQPVQLSDFLRADADEPAIQEQPIPQPPKNPAKKPSAVAQLTKKASNSSFASIL